MPEYPTRVEEIRTGRNFVRAGDLIRVAPPAGSPAGTHGYPARFVYADEDKGGVYACVRELEKNEKGILVACGFRFVAPLSRIERKASTSDPLRRAKLKREEKRS